jgi:hypothetical protein
MATLPWSPVGTGITFATYHDGAHELSVIFLYPKEYVDW